MLFDGEAAPQGSALKQVEPEEIKRVFLRAARRCHPDLARSVGEDEGALTRRFQELQTAYTTILAHLEQTVVVGSAPGSGPGQGPKGPCPLSRERTRDPVRPLVDEARWGSPEVSMSGAHWIGPLPDRPLRLGRYLYYTGRISRECLSDALSWQRSQRPDFGSTAVKLGLLGELELGTILDARRMDERIGRTAVRLGLLSPEMRDWVVTHQQRAQRPLGAYFIERGMLSEHDLDAALVAQQRHNETRLSADGPSDAP